MVAGGQNRAAHLLQRLPERPRPAGRPVALPAGTAPDADLETCGRRRATTTRLDLDDYPARRPGMSGSALSLHARRRSFDSAPPATGSGALCVGVFKGG